MRTVKIALGAISPSIKSQLKKQKFTFKEEDIKKCQKLSNAILMLKFAGIVTDSESDKMQQKLTHKIGEYVTYEG